MSFVRRAGSEVKSVRNSTPAPVSERERPETLDFDWFVSGTLEQSAEFSFRGEGHDRPTSEVTDEQFARVLAECTWRERDAPRRIDLLKLAAGVFARGEANECPG